MGFLERLREKRRLTRLDPVAIELARAQARKTGGVMWLAAAASMIGTLTSLGRGLLYTGEGLSVTAAMAMSAVLTLDHYSDRGTPRIVRWAVYALMLLAAACLFAGLIRRWFP